MKLKTSLSAILLRLFKFLIGNFLIGLFFFVGCTDSKKKIINGGLKNSIITDDSLKNLILTKGDTTAYYSLKVDYLDDSNEGLLFWSLVMANKYNFPEAYYDVFFILRNSFNNDWSNKSLDNMDNNTREFALKYLTIAANKNSLNAKEDLELYCREGKYNLPSYCNKFSDTTKTGSIPY
jgi:hypothetical protein